MRVSKLSKGVIVLAAFKTKKRISCFHARLFIEQLGYVAIITKKLTILDLN